MAFNKYVLVLLVFIIFNIQDRVYATRLGLVSKYSFYYMPWKHPFIRIDSLDFVTLGYPTSTTIVSPTSTPIGSPGFITIGSHAFAPTDSSSSFRLHCIDDSIQI